MTTLLQMGDESMRPRLQKMVRGMLSIAERDGDALRFPTYRWAQTLKPEWFAPANVPEKWQGYRYASMTALARYAQVSQDPAAIELGLGLARNYMRHGDVPANGHYRANTHSGGVLPVSVDIARLGIAFGQPDMVAWAQRVYEWTRANTPAFGFLQDGLGLDGFFAGTCETCGLADYIHLAVLLSEAGVGDYWDDIDRTARNQLLENQYRDTNAMRQAFPGIADRVLAMLHGGFECAAYPNDLFTYSGAEGCCIGGGMRALYLTWRSAIDSQRDETRVRLGITRTTAQVEVIAFEPWEGRIDVRALQSQRIAIRLPAYVNPADTTVFVDGAGVSLHLKDRDAIFEQVNPGQVVSLRYPLPRMQRLYTIADKDYEADWLGNVVIDMRPTGTRHPIYRRRAWLDTPPTLEHSRVPRFTSIDAPVLW